MITLRLTERQAKDVQLALFYVEQLEAHGSANHNWMTLVAHLADTLGVGLAMYSEGIELPCRARGDTREILVEKIEVVGD